MEFIDLLMEKMQKRDITAYKLCKDLEIGQSTFSSWKKGKKPTIEKLIAICQYLEVSSDELLGITIENQNLFELNGEEEYVIEMYRKSSPRGRIAIREYAAFEASRAKSYGFGPDQESEAN